MTATATSVEAYREGSASGEFTGLRMRVLRELRIHGPCTARELAKASGLPEQSQKRLPELVRDGAAVVLCERPCRITGRTAQVWAVKDSRGAADGPLATGAEGDAHPARSVNPDEGPRHGAESGPGGARSRVLITFAGEERGRGPVISQRHTTSSRRPGADIHGSVKVLAPGAVVVAMASQCPCGTVSPCPKCGQGCTATGHLHLCASRDRPEGTAAHPEDFAGPKGTDGDEDAGSAALSLQHQP